MAAQPPRSSPAFDPEAVHAKYLAERDKRLVEGRSDIRDLGRTSTSLATATTRSPRPSSATRSPTRSMSSSSVAGSPGSWSAPTSVRPGSSASASSTRPVASGAPGTGTSYPGVMCDVESYIYMPMLEELDYIPTRRYAYGDEIRGHLERDRRAVSTWTDDALFHTGVTRAEWHEDAARWRIHTDRGDEVELPLVRPGRRDPQPHETARHRGHGGLRRPLVPHGALGLRVHRWRDRTTPLDRLGDKVVALLGTGASGHPVPAAVGRVGKARLRVPAHALGHRRTGQPAHRARLRRRTSNQGGSGPAWTTSRRSCWASPSTSTRWTTGGRTTTRPSTTRRSREGMTRGRHRAQRRGSSTSRSWRNTGGASTRSSTDPEQGRDPQAVLPLHLQAALLPRRVPTGVQQPAASRLIDCPAGIERITENGLVVDGEQYEVDCIIYGTGFEAERTPLHRRAGHEIVGRDGVTLAEKWADGPRTPLRHHEPRLPQLFVMPAPTQQSVVTVNYTQLAVLGAEFVGRRRRPARATAASTSST